MSETPITSADPAADTSAASELRELLDELRSVTGSLTAASAAPVSSEAPQQLPYASVVEHVHATVEALVPRDAVVAVVSRGDGDLIRLRDRQGWHFPQLETGVYAGYHPADANEAIAQLNQVLQRGAEYLVFPATSYWWFDQYPDFREYLDTRHELIADDAVTCAIYRLRSLTPMSLFEQDELTTRDADQLRRQVEDVVAALLPPDEHVAAVQRSGATPLQIANPTTTILHVGQDAATADLALLDEVRQAASDGVGYLIVPATCASVLSRHRPLRRYLARGHRLVVHHEHVCSIFQLFAGQAPAQRTFGWRGWIDGRA